MRSGSTGIKMVLYICIWMKCCWIRSLFLHSVGSDMRFEEYSLCVFSTRVPFAGTTEISSVLL